MVGLIPIAGYPHQGPTNFPPHLTRLSEQCIAIQRSAYECVLAGCDSIWVICNDDISPLTKRFLGDYLMDTDIFKHWDFIANKEDHKRFIPIYYVPISQKDRNRRDSLGWSILHGALTSFLVSSKISSWLKPSKYFVSFPYGIIDPFEVAKYRKQIKSKRPFFLSFQGKTVRDNLYLPFAFNPEDWLRYKRQIKNNCTGGDTSLPAHERWSSKNFTLDKIFKYDNIESIDFVKEIPRYYEINTWRNYRDFCKSDFEVPKIPKTVIKPYFIR